MYEEQLQEIGLTENEARIYLFLLQSGSCGPGTVAGQLGFHRGYVYETLARMQEKGAVNSVMVKGKSTYQATNPVALTESIKFRFEKFARIVPDLESMQRREDTNVEFHRGTHVYQTLIKDILATAAKGDEVLLLGIDEKTLSQEIEPIYLKKYLNIIREKHVSERVIVASGTKKLKSASVSYRELPAAYLGGTAQIIYADRTATFIDGLPRHLVVIRSKEVADTHRKRFDLLWKTAH